MDEAAKRAALKRVGEAFVDMHILFNDHKRLTQENTRYEKEIKRLVAENKKLTKELKPLRAFWDRVQALLKTKVQPFDRTQISDTESFLVVTATLKEERIWYREDGETVEGDHIPEAFLDEHNNEPLILGVTLAGKL